MTNRSLIMSEGMKALRSTLGTVGAEVFVFTLKAEDPFNYTEWRRDNLFADMTADELLDASAEYAKTHRPDFKRTDNSVFVHSRGSST